MARCAEQNGDGERRGSDGDADEDWPATAWGEDLAPAAGSSRAGGLFCRLMEPETPGLRTDFLHTSFSFWNNGLTTLLSHLFSLSLRRV